MANKFQQATPEGFATDGRNYSCFKRKRSVNHFFFEDINSPLKAYWLGFLCADGHIGSGRYLVVNLHRKDREHLVLLNKALDSDYPIKDKDYLRKPRKNKTEPYIEYKSGLTIGSKRLCDFLQKKGCLEKKSLILKFPTDNYVSYDLVKHFISGFFDGNGSIYSQKQKNRYGISITSSHSFVNDLFLTFVKLGINGISKRVSLTSDKVSILEINNKQGIKDFYEKIYSNSPIHLERKLLKFKKFYEEKFSQRDPIGI